MRFLIILVAIVALAWFAAAQIPLGYALRKAPLNDMGVQWTQSEGTVWDGRIMGVYLNGQPVGDVDVALKPMSLVMFKPSLDVQWGGAGGRGAGTVTLLGGDAVRASDVRLQQNVSALESLSTDLRSVGGTFRLSGGDVRIDGDACTQASGALQTDTLSIAAQQFGREFSDVTGALGCENGAFDLTMTGQGPAGDTIAIDANATLQGEATINVVIDTQDRDIQMFLANAGFSREDGTWTYRRDATPGGAGTP
ncbi:MAG: type II secretion system protein N [Henriciella sp.]|uniref:type II secretion system protein N n=1 Tax=Henriciella sp. TaxID=1968823 RepID=UPI0032EA94FB